MLAAALVPDTTLLVPGVAGRAEVLADVRAAALAAVADLLAAGPARVVVVATDAPHELSPPGRPSLGAVGFPDVVPSVPAGARHMTKGGPPGVAGTATSVALVLLQHAGWRGDVVAVGTDRAPNELAVLGRGLGADDGVLLAGSLSARRGPDGPLLEDARAPGHDDAVVADLVDLGPTARDRLAAVPQELARELAVTAWGPWQVLVGAAGTTRPLVGSLRHLSAPFGCTYVVLSWAVR